MFTKETFYSYFCYHEDMVVCYIYIATGNIGRPAQLHPPEDEDALGNLLFMHIFSCSFALQITGY